MAEVITEIGSQISNAYNQLFSSMPAWLQQFTNITFLIIVVTLYCLFVWRVYRFISKKDIIKLNLNQYNKSSHPFLVKFLGAVFYFLEYIILLPLWVFVWFAMFTVFLIFLTKGLEISTLLLISTVIVVSIRATAYYREELSRDLAKLLPFTLLAVSMTEKGFFNFQEILNKFSQLPSFFGSILTYLGIIITLEIILRVFHFIFSLFSLEEPEEEEEPVKLN
ncbi:MAG: hypothetical protein ABIE36_01520 [Candidatus Diapherotrites archaeon]